MKRIIVFVGFVCIFALVAIPFRVSSANPTATPTASLFGVDLSTPTYPPKTGGIVQAAATPESYNKAISKATVPPPPIYPTFPPVNHCSGFGEVLNPTEKLAGMLPSLYTSDFWDMLTSKGIERKEVEAGVKEFFNLTGLKNSLGLTIRWYAVDDAQLLFRGCTERYIGNQTVRFITLNVAYLNRAGYRDTALVVAHELFHSFVPTYGVYDYAWRGKNSEGQVVRAVYMQGESLYDGNGYLMYGNFEESLVQFLDGHPKGYNYTLDVTYDEYYILELLDHTPLTRADVAKLHVQKDGIWKICTAIFQQQYPDLKGCTPKQLFYLIASQQLYSYQGANVVKDFFTHYVEWSK